MAKNIINGPYLLDPRATQITVAWEAIVPQAFKVTARAADGTEHPGAVAYQREEKCQEYPQGACVYTAVIEGLEPATEYAYTITGDGEVAAASFTTLPESPEHLHLLTLSDSHLFHNSAFFKKVVAQEAPEFILHGGDISFGTGYQHDQYQDNWFHKIPELLARVPAYYIHGNHDDGPFYDAFFTATQGRTVHTADGGNTFSFDYGPAHFTLIDSNPWGLFEMNAVNSEMPLDRETRKRIDDTLKWIEEDLTSPAAKKAKWRILMMHHPYTDPFNNRYIVPIAERCKAQLVLGGHLHYYIKSVSVDPKVGARTVYICEGSAQDPEAEYTPAREEKRLFSEFPEVTAKGRSNYGILDVTEKAIDYRLYGFRQDGSPELVDTIHLTHDEPEITFTDIELRRLDNNGNVEVRALAENKGTAMAEAVINLFDNKCEHAINLFGNEENSQVAVLEPGEKRKLTAVYQAVQPGEHTLRVGEAELKLVVFEPTQLSFAHMRVRAGQGEEADCMIAGIEATNNLDHEIFISVPLYINQRIAETKRLFFRGHEKRYIEFHYKFQQGGEYQVSIADQLPKEVSIEGGIRIIPRILDKSGHGHTALLHGSPKVREVDGRMEVALEQYGDYIEIPASRDLRAPQGFTGMVWAEIDRLARPSEMGHNPLMVRGKSVGWGATYCLRMVVERAGGLKWGICHDITEYSWQGGEAKIGDWAQYTMTFDKQRGGDSYCDGKQLAHVAGISDDSEIRQWDDQPIFVGYSYIGHVIPEIGRPKYFTHLPGRISQVRFYKKGLTAEENQKIYEHPEAEGPERDDLAVWLDFHSILKVGTHTTEWRHPAIYDPAFKTQKKYWHFKQLKAKTHLPLQASLRATVEVSDDMATVKGSRQIVLKDGTNYVDISNLPEAQYLRIVTDFAAEVGPDGTFVPELLSYQVVAENERDFTDMFWSTRPDWERGCFTGAVGFPPVDRLRDYPEYTDVIHG